jgi:hypothetical protein
MLVRQPGKEFLVAHRIGLLVGRGQRPLLVVVHHPVDARGDRALLDHLLELGVAAEVRHVLSGGAGLATQIQHQ